MSAGETHNEGRGPEVQVGAEPDGFHQRLYKLPADATEVILVRHGASEPIAAGDSFALLDGRGDPELAPEGRAQAERVAVRLAEEQVDRLFVTPLRRTHETAAAIVALSGAEWSVVPDLVEIGLGELDGGQFRIRTREADPVALAVYESERWDVLPGAEPADEYTARLRAGIDQVVAETGPGRVAIAVVHGGVIGELCRLATDARRFAFVHSDNGSLSRLVVHGDGHWLLRGFNDVSHLAGL